MIQKHKVLIIDNDSNSASLLGRFLTGNSLDVMMTANDFEMAKELLANNKPHIVLLGKGMGGSADERNKITDFINGHLHLPVIIITHDEHPILNFMPSLNCIYVPFPKIISHYYSHLLVTIDNMLNSGIMKHIAGCIIEVKVKKVLLNKNGEPLYKKQDKSDYCKMDIDLHNVDSMRANNCSCKNSSLLWLHDNPEYCLQENKSLIKLGIRHISDNMVRISRQEMVKEDMIDSFVLHRTIKIGNRILDIGNRYKKAIDALLLSIPRLNLN